MNHADEYLRPTDQTWQQISLYNPHANSYAVTGTGFTFRFRTATHHIKQMEFVFFLKSDKLKDTTFIFTLKIGNTYVQEHVTLANLTTSYETIQFSGYSGEVNGNVELQVKASTTGTEAWADPFTAKFYGDQTALLVSGLPDEVYLDKSTRTATIKANITGIDNANIRYEVSYSPFQPRQGYIYQAQWEFQFEWTEIIGSDSAVRTVKIYDTAGRIYTKDITVKRYPIAFTLKYETMTVGQTQVLTIQDPYNRYSNLNCQTQGGNIAYDTYGPPTSEKYQITLTEQKAFVDITENNWENELPLSIHVWDSNVRDYYIPFKLIRTPLGCTFIGPIDSTTTPETNYSVTGDQFTLSFSGRENRELSIFFSSDGAALLNPSGESTYVSNEDEKVIDCLKRWFDDANVTVKQTMNVRAFAQDNMRRGVELFFEVRAGNDMKPIVTVVNSTLQPAKTPRGTDWPSKLADYYVQGYSKAKFEATVTAPTNAEIKSVYLKSSRLGTVQLTKNNTTGKYEKVTQTALTADTPYTIEVTDQRGLKTVTPEQTIVVLPYKLPNIENVSYYRVNSSGQKTDDGNRCFFKSSFFYSPLYIPDTEEALNEKYATAVFGGVDAYRDYVPAHWRPSGTSLSMTVMADTERSYEIEFYADDLLNSVHVSYTLSTAGVIMDFLAGGKGIGLGKVAETSRMVEVNPDWILQANNINVQVSSETISSIGNYSGQVLDLGTVLKYILDKL